MKPFCVVAFGAHPDDVELSASGTLLVHKALGHQTGIVNLSRGELGTRGTPETRESEAKASAEILGVDYLLNLGLPDGSILNTPEHRLAVIAAIRETRPDIILCNAPKDRHPDHGNASLLVRESAFLSGLVQIKTTNANGQEQTPHRPRLVLDYIQDMYHTPDIVIDFSAHFERRMESIRAFKTQFYDPNSPAPNTYISTPAFYEGLIHRAKHMGQLIGVAYGEGFLTQRPLGVPSLADLY